MRSVQGGPQAQASLETLRESLDRDGYAIFDSRIVPATLDAASSDSDAQIRPEGSIERLVRRGRRAVLGKHTTVSARTTRRVQDAWTVSANVRAIAEAPAVLELLEQLYGRRPLSWQTLNFKVGSEQNAHSDAMYFNSDPPGFMCGVWIALEDIDETCGPVVYYPGSQKLPELNMDSLRAATGRTDGDAYEEHVMTLVAEAGIEPAHATLAKGQALLWASNLVHGGSPQTDRSRTRWSQVTHYVFEGCRMWKPFLSDDERHYFEPTLIR